MSHIARNGTSAYIGLPEREAAKLQDLWQRDEVGLELSVEVHAPVVVGIYPMRIARFVLYQASALNGHANGNGSGNGQRQQAPANNGNRKAANNGNGNGSAKPSYATSAQVRAIRAIANRVGTNLDQLLRDRFHPAFEKFITHIAHYDVVTSPRSNLGNTVAHSSCANYANNFTHCNFVS